MYLTTVSPSFLIYKWGHAYLIRKHLPYVPKVKTWSVGWAYHLILSASSLMISISIMFSPWLELLHGVRLWSLDTSFLGEAMWGKFVQFAVRRSMSSPSSNSAWLWPWTIGLKPTSQDCCKCWLREKLWKYYNLLDRMVKLPYAIALKEFNWHFIIFDLLHE